MNLDTSVVFIDAMKLLWMMLAAVAVAILVLVGTHVRQDLGWIDSVSGSPKSQTVWRFGISSTPEVSESLLTARFRQLGLRWEPDWKRVRGTYVDILGRNMGYAHGQAPEIVSLAVNAELQKSYLAASSDDEIRELFRALSRGGDDDKQAAVDAACAKGLREYGGLGAMSFCCGGVTKLGIFHDPRPC